MRDKNILVRIAFMMVIGFFLDKDMVFEFYVIFLLVNISLDINKIT